jgi:hypothetical protein
MGWLVKLLFIVMLAPFFMCLVLQLVLGLAAAILPWVLLLAVVAGAAGGLAVAVFHRRRLSSPKKAPRAPATSAGQYKVKRPRGVRGRDEE